MKLRETALTALCAGALLLVATSSLAAGRYDAKLRFRVLRTPHFTIYFHQGEDALAERLAVIAEEVRTDLAGRTGLDAPRHTHVVIVDQSDIANGWSTPLPYDLIEIAAVAPPPSDFLGNHDDWLQMVVVHEYAHLLHLDRVGGVMKGLRWTLGRNAATFPNLFVPQWAVEGITTWAESAVTGRGRLNAADVAGVVSLTAASGGAAIDRAGGGLVAWPSGHAPYFLGGTFDQALVAKRGALALGNLSRETARRLPFLGGGAYRTAFGASAGDLWRDVFTARSEPAASPASDLVRLTREGFAVSGPRIVRRRGVAGLQADAVFFTSQGPHRFPDIRRVPSAGGQSTHVASRFDGRALASDGRWIYFDQLEFDGPSALVADLYAFDLESGRTRRLSRAKRLTDPDISPSGDSLVAVQAHDGEKRLTVWRMARSADGSPVLASFQDRRLGRAGCQYASPRWSPDGRAIAAARQCRGELPAIVVIGAGGDAESVVASGSRNVTPAWSPDGRYVVFASDREDRRFKLFAVDWPRRPESADAPVVVLDAPGGVMWPDISPDGRTAVFASLTPDGYDVFTAGLPPRFAVGTSRPGNLAQPSEPASAVQPGQEGGGSIGADRALARTGYSPWRTLLPRAWSPLVSLNGEDVSLGAAVSASDVLGYHQYRGTVAWYVSGQQADISFGTPPLGWTLDYAYNRWRPSVLLTAWQSLDTVGISEDGVTISATAQERSQGLFAGVYLPWRRVRLAQNWLLGVNVDERILPDAVDIPARWRNGLRAGWALTSAHEYGYSISPEDGIRTSMNVERVMPPLGADQGALTLTADVRGYLAGLRSHHVLAVRAAAASSTGDASMLRTFNLGGSGVLATSFDIGEHAIGLLRGLPPGERAGTAVLVGNVDYRFPLKRVERGIRTWPFFLRDVHGAIFADVGSAGRSLDNLPAVASSVGGEIASRITLGYSWNLSLAAGAAWVHDPARPVQPDRLAAFVRSGYAF